MVKAAGIQLGEELMQEVKSGSQRLLTNTRWFYGNRLPVRNYQQVQQAPHALLDGMSCHLSDENVTKH